MKLRNLMYATMIACAFASCSKDDVIDPVNPTPEEGSLVITVGTVQAQSTKVGESNQSSDEMTINNMTVNVYEVGGTEVAPTYTFAASTSTSTSVVPVNNLAGNAATQLTISGLKLNTKYICFGYANIDGAPVASSTEYKTPVVVSIPTDGFKSTSLPMTGSSNVVTLGGDDNVATIDLVRAVSRVDVVRLELDIDQATKAPKADAATFQLEGFSINGVTSTVKSDASYQESAQYWGGLAADLWNNTVGEKAFYLKNVFNPAPEVVSDTKGSEKAVTIYTASNSAPVASFYILPNPAAQGSGIVPTTLVLKGQYGYTAGSTTIAPVSRDYPIVIAQSGLGDNATGAIQQNKLYRIGITVAGIGTEDGKNADMLIQASVSDYELMEQNVVAE